MRLVVVDVEADGPIPGKYSMVCLGAVFVGQNLETRFSAKLKPVSESFVPEALAVSGFTREQTLEDPFRDPADVMTDFAEWLDKNGGGHVRFVSDNNGFDWMFVAWYFHQYLGRNPFGHSSINLGSLYQGMVRDMGQSFKHLRATIHTHDPLDDAIGNAEAMMVMINHMGLKISE